jgi:hypothetical protein
VLNNATPGCGPYDNWALEDTAELAFTADASNSEGVILRKSGKRGFVVQSLVYKKLKDRRGKLSGS